MGRRAERCPGALSLFFCPAGRPSETGWGPSQRCILEEPLGREHDWRLADLFLIGGRFLGDWPVDPVVGPDRTVICVAYVCVCVCIGVGIGYTTGLINKISNVRAKDQQEKEDEYVIQIETNTARGRKERNGKKRDQKRHENNPQRSRRRNSK